jgi:O-antigen ligase
MQAITHSQQPFLGERSVKSPAHSRVPSLLATAIGYFVILYLYSSLAWIVMMLYPAIKVAYFLYFLLAALPFLLAVNRSTVDILRDHWSFVFLIVLYFLYVSVQYVLFDMADLPSVREAYFENGQFLVTIFISLIAFELSINFRHLLTVLYAVVIASCVLNVIEFFDQMAFPIQLSTVIGRAAGLYQNPNVSADFIAGTIPLICGRSGRTSRLLCYAITGVGTFLTFSRGGWGLWFAAVAITELALVDWKNFRFNSGNIAIVSAFMIGVIALVIAFGPALSLITGELGSNLDLNTATRLQLLTNDTTLSRLELARQGLIAFTSAPIFGHGVGYTWQWEFGLSVHNMFVLVLAEQGILGFIWLMTLLAVWWRYPRPYGWWLVVLFCVTGVSTHNFFDGPMPGILITLYLVAAKRFGEARI